MMSSQQQQQADDNGDFRAGLRVLVVDDDPEFLKGIENNLKKFKYEVTTCGSAQWAIDLLRERSPDWFALVMCGVNRPEMDGFKFITYARMFEADLPIIMMSDYGDEAMIMKGCELNTTHNIYKPLEPTELSCIWQHAHRRRVWKMTAEDEMVPPLCEGGGVLLNNEAVPPLCEGGGGVDAIATSSGNKRNAESDVDPRPAKKGRFIWTDERHQRFVAAFEKLGKMATPLRIMAEMNNMPGLTRDIVSSHLQKYKIALDRAQQEQEDSRRQCAL